MKILDSSVIIAFYSEIDDPGVLHKLIELGYKLCIPKGVFEEVLRGKTRDKLKLNIEKGNIEVLDEIDEEVLKKFKNRYPYLGRGEIEVILWGMKLKSEDHKSPCIIDDRKARTVATKHGLIFTGTIGLIELLEGKGKISLEQKKEYIMKLVSKGFRIPKSYKNLY